MWEIITRFSTHFTDIKHRNGPNGYKDFSFYLCFSFHISKWNVQQFQFKIKNLIGMNWPTSLPQNPTQTKGPNPPPSSSFMATSLEIQECEQIRKIHKQKQRKAANSWSGINCMWNYTIWQESGEIKQPGNEYYIC